MLILNGSRRYRKLNENSLSLSEFYKRGIAMLFKDKSFGFGNAASSHGGLTPFENCIQKKRGIALGVGGLGVSHVARLNFKTSLVGVNIKWFTSLSEIE